MKVTYLPTADFIRDKISHEKTIASGDAFHVKKGLSPCDGRFTSHDKLILLLEIPAGALVPFNQLSLSVNNESETDLLAGLTLRPRAGSDSILFSGNREELRPGTRVLKFPREAFGFYGDPADWDNVCEIEIAIGFDRNFSGSTYISISDVKLEGESRVLVNGPRLTEDALRRFKRAARESAWEPDRSPGFYVPAPNPYGPEDASEILASRIMGQDVGEPIDWSLNPFRAHEWQHFLHRHHFLRPLIKGFLDTRDLNYLKKCESAVTSWITAHPVTVNSNGGAGPAWETLTAAWRLREWIWLRRYAWSHLDEGFQNLLLRSAWEHAGHLLDHKGHPTNWIIVESAALTLAGFHFPFFDEARSRVRMGMERLTVELNRQFYPDGAHFEISPLYHAICLDALMEVCETAGKHGYAVARKLKKLEKAAEFLAALCRPDFTWPSLNDSGPINGDYCALMNYCGQMFDRPDFVWIGSKGQIGTAPTWKSRAFSSAGLAVMRSSHEISADYLLFRAGPAGAAHCHDDVLSVEIGTRGKTRVVDPGVSDYKPTELTQGYRSASAHNMILVDGKAPTRSQAPYFDRMKPCRNFGFRTHKGSKVIRGSAEIIMDAGDIIKISRQIEHVESRCWLITDRVKGTGSHLVTVSWQFVPGPTDFDPETATIWQDEDEESGIGIMPIGQIPNDVNCRTGSLDPVSGWVSIDYADIAAPLWTYEFVCGLPFESKWLILPFDTNKIVAT